MTSKYGPGYEWVEHGLRKIDAQDKLKTMAERWKEMLLAESKDRKLQELDKFSDAGQDLFLKIRDVLVTTPKKDPNSPYSALANVDSATNRLTPVYTGSGADWLTDLCNAINQYLDDIK
jgi:hypothetical protein